MRKLYFIFLFLFLCKNGEAQITILSTGATYTEDFNTMSNTAKVTIPSGFKIGTDWATGLTMTDTSAGTTGTGILTSTSKGYCYNYGNGINSTSTDRALGILCTNSYTGKSIVMKITNNSGYTINQLYISWDYEKYRSGSRQWNITFFSGTSTNPTTAQTSGDQIYLADADNTIVYNPPTTIHKYVIISSLSIPNGSSYYLRWAITGVGGNTNGQALAIDNFKVSMGDALLPIELGDFTVKQDGTVNIIKWITYSEQNTKEFLIQRSYNTFSWEDVSYVLASGNSTYKQEYNVNDYMYSKNEKIIYYRLLSYDYSNEVQISNVISIMNNSLHYFDGIKYYNIYGQEINPKETPDNQVIISITNNCAKKIIKIH